MTIEFHRKKQNIRPCKFINGKIMRVELFHFNEFIEEKRRETKECFSVQFCADWTMVTL